MSKSIHIKPNYVSSPSHRKEDSLAYKLFMSLVVLLMALLSSLAA